jgi:hypothetical protein
MYIGKFTFNVLAPPGIIGLPCVEVEEVEVPAGKAKRWKRITSPEAELTTFSYYTTQAAADTAQRLLQGYPGTTQQAQLENGFGVLNYILAVDKAVIVDCQRVLNSSFGDCWELEVKWIVWGDRR